MTCRVSLISPGISFNKVWHLAVSQEIFLPLRASIILNHRRESSRIIDG